MSRPVQVVAALAVAGAAAVVLATVGTTGIDVPDALVLVLALAALARAAIRLA